MTDKNTIIAALIAGAIYVTSMFWLASNDSPNFWFWSSVIAWGFLAIFIIRFIALHATLDAKKARYDKKELLIIQQYMEAASAKLMDSTSPLAVIMIYENLLINLLQKGDRTHFDAIHNILDQIFKSQTLLTSAQNTGNVSLSSNGETHDTDSNQANTDGDAER